MAYNETNATVVGRVSSEVTVRSTMDGTHVANLRVASNERRYDRSTGAWVDGEQLFVSVVCWDRLAQHVQQSLRIGDPVLVTGKLAVRSYEVEGQQRTAVELTARAIGPDLTWCTAALTRTSRDAPAEPGAGPADQGGVRAA